MKMPNFIEVTEIDGTSDGTKKLINTAWIIEIWVLDDIANIRLGFTPTGNYYPCAIAVKESYEEIKRMIWRGNNA
jgi:hypothetical protein